MKIVFVVASSDNGVIGRKNQLPWHMPADLRHFREVTGTSPVIMGRKTYESVGKPLPNRRTIVVTRKRDLQFDGCDVVHSLADAIELARHSNPAEICIVGGSEIFREATPLADRIYLTRIHGTFGGDAIFEVPSPDQWRETSREDHRADGKNPFAYSFITLDRAR